MAHRVYSPHSSEKSDWYNLKGEILSSTEEIEVHDIQHCNFVKMCESIYYEPAS